MRGPIGRGRRLVSGQSTAKNLFRSVASTDEVVGLMDLISPDGWPHVPGKLGRPDEPTQLGKIDNPSMQAGCRDDAR